MQNGRLLQLKQIVYFSAISMMKVIVLFFLYSPMTLAVLEQAADDFGNIVWKPGRYRNRDAIPLPTRYDPDKKHKRETDEDDNNEDENINAKPSKKSFIKHFSLPLGPEIPFGYSIGGSRKGKKDIVAHVPLEEKLKGDTLKPVALTEEKSRRSKIPKTWGLTWEDPYPRYRSEESGYERSNLEGLSNTGKISEEEFESGLMGRGLGGMKERAQNEILMEKVFEQKLEDENDVETENSARRRLKRFIFFPPHIHHYGHHSHYHENGKKRPPNNDRHPSHSLVEFSAANNTLSVMGSINVAPQRAHEPIQNVTSLYVSQQLPINSTANMTDGEQRQFKQREGKVSGAQGGDTTSGNENDEFEYQPQYGSVPDGEYDKQYPNAVDGSPWQYQNHNPHHNVFNQHLHNPYKMHRAHGDYKNIHPAHPYEQKMNQTVEKNYNFSTPLLEANRLKKTETPAPSAHRWNSISAELRHFLFIGGKTEGRHRDEDLSPAEIIV